MQSDNPDLPEATPAIPDPTSEVIQQVGETDPLEQDYGVNALTDSGRPSDAGSSPPADPEEDLPGVRDLADWSDLDEAEPDQVGTAPPAGKAPSRATTPQDSANQDWIETEIPYHPKPLGVIDQIFLLLTDGLAFWRRGLRWLRSQLPPEWQRKLSDELLTAMLLGLVVLLVVLGGPSGGRSPQAVDRPAPHSPRVEPTVARDQGVRTTPQSPLEIAPEPTPEANLIADIQAQVSRISRSYSAELIQSVEVTLAPNTLVIDLEETWYGLLTSQQDSIAQEIYDQAQQLGFTNLKFRAPDGLIVARSPVVGSTIVVLQRHRPDLSLAPA